MSDGHVHRPAWLGDVAASVQPEGLPIGNHSTADVILASAAMLFGRNGYSKTTTTDLGRAAGIRGPSVYHHFKTKEEILLGICCESLSRLSSAVSAAADAQDEPMARLEAMMEAHVENLLVDQDMHLTTFLEMRWLTDAGRQTVAAQRDAYEAAFIEAIASAKASGDLRADIGAREMTLAFLGLANWPVFWFRSEGALSAHDIAKLMLAIFLNGVQVKEECPSDGVAHANGAA
jgi:AcrR family transcriptional regulator